MPNPQPQSRSPQPRQPRNINPLSVIFCMMLLIIGLFVALVIQARGLSAQIITINNLQRTIDTQRETIKEKDRAIDYLSHPQIYQQHLQQPLQQHLWKR